VPVVALTPDALRAASLHATIPAGSLDHARAAIQAGHLSVTVIGDSIAEGADSKPELTWWSLLGDATKSLTANVVMSNRALGARSSSEYLNPLFLGEAQEPADLGKGYGSRGYSDRTWVQPGQTWETATQASTPDLLVINFAVNEVYSDDTPEAAAARWRIHLTGIIQHARTWNHRPDIVVMTALTPTTAVPGVEGIPDVIKRQWAVEAVSREVAAQEHVALADPARAWEVLLGRADPVTGQQAPALYSETDLLGVHPGTYDGSNGIGGNGNNHPSHLASREIYFQTLKDVMAALR